MNLSTGNLDFPKSYLKIIEVQIDFSAQDEDFPETGTLRAGERSVPIPGKFNHAVRRWGADPGWHDSCTINPAAFDGLNRLCYIDSGVPRYDWRGVRPIALPFRRELCQYDFDRACSRPPWPAWYVLL